MCENCKHDPEEEVGTCWGHCDGCEDCDCEDCEDGFSPLEVCVMFRDTILKVASDLMEAKITPAIAAKKLKTLKKDFSEIGIQPSIHLDSEEMEFLGFGVQGQLAAIPTWLKPLLADPLLCIPVDAIPEEGDQSMEITINVVEVPLADIKSVPHSPFLPALILIEEDEDEVSEGDLILDVEDEPSV